MEAVHAGAHHREDRARLHRRALAAGAVLGLLAAGCSSSSDGGPATPTATPLTSPTPVIAATATATPTPTMVAQPLYRISGRLLGAGRSYAVTLQPLGRMTASVDDSFAFDDVAPGHYVLEVDDACGQVPCFAATPVDVVDGDVAVDLTYDLCPAPTITPSLGPPGTNVGASGRCYYFHSGRHGFVFFDDVQVGVTSNGDTIGYYGAHFSIPTDATPGEHTITFSATESPGGAGASETFLVTAD